MSVHYNYKEVEKYKAAMRDAGRPIVAAMTPSAYRRWKIKNTKKGYQMSAQNVLPTKQDMTTFLNNLKTIQYFLRSRRGARAVGDDTDGIQWEILFDIEKGYFKSFIDELPFKFNTCMPCIVNEIIQYRKLNDFNTDIVWQLTTGTKNNDKQD